MIRHSNLPKLAQCPRYESQAVAGPAAERGTRLDGLFRNYIQRDELPEDLDPEEADAIRWAATTLKALAGGDYIETDEAKCKVATPGMEHIGTADAVVLERGMHADLKSGQIRNYMEQMAAYALGFMEANFAGEWTSHLLFCDQKQVVTHTFTYAEAERIVGDILSKVANPTQGPKLCDYCGWCAKSETCAPRKEALSEALAVTPEGFDAVLADGDRLGDFLRKCKVLDDFREKAEAKARELLEAGLPVSGFKLRKGRESEIVFPEDIARHLTDLGLGPVVEAYGAMSAKKFRDLWEKQLPATPFPADIVRKKPASKPSLIES